MSPTWKKLIVSGSNAELNTLTVTNDIDVQSLGINNGTTEVAMTSSVKTGIYNATELIDPVVPMALYSGTSIEYTAQRNLAVRTGTIMASWSGSSITYTDISNTDVGETWDLSFNLVNVGDNIRLRAYSLGSGSGDWTVHCLFKLFPNLL